MNGTTLRLATAVACVAALAAPAGAVAAKPKKHRVSHKAQQIVVPHKYLAGGDGMDMVPVPAGVRVNLFDPLDIAQSLGNQALTQLGLPPLPALPQI